jgi:hypothetical protein
LKSPAIAPPSLAGRRSGSPARFLQESPIDADGLARSPASIASFLEAAGAAALEQVGKILVRRI